MKPFLETVKENKQHPSFHLQEVELSQKPTNWHYHKDIELTYVVKGEGVRVVGDHLGHFKAGDLMITGENLPHDFNMQSSDKSALFVVIQFKKELVNQFPELASVNTLINSSRQGILFAPQAQKIIDFLIGFTKLSPAEQIIGLFDLLLQLSLQTEFTTLCSAAFTTNKIGDLQLSRLNQVIDFVNSNFARSIELQEIANLACMTEPSFCRWFKRTMECSFVSYLNKSRVEQAAMFLVNTDKQIGFIASECGFETLSTFNRTFKFYKGIPPMQYRKQWRNL